MKNETLQSEAKLFRALMHPVRLAILETLRDGEECVCHMEAALGYRQSYISQQLAVLKEAGLVRDRRDGWNVFYWVTEPEVFPLLDAARKIVGEPVVDRKAAVRSASCPCPKCNTPVAEVAS
ncbi:MAG: metalloregulator ArsR/SmtB family transcription factor [Anaerolineae bacterium]